MEPVHLQALSQSIGMDLEGRTGGAVTLAVGMTDIFTGIPWFAELSSYFYQFVIMFEAVFILTAIDAGTRVARYLIQDFGGNVYKPLKRTNWVPGTILLVHLPALCGAIYCIQGYKLNLGIIWCIQSANGDHWSSMWSDDGIEGRR